MARRKPVPADPRPRIAKGFCVELLSNSVAFVVAAICAGLMGYAIQRGATCTVVAVDEVVHGRRVHRLASMFAASLWVLGGLAVARSLHLPGNLPAGYPVTGVTALGGAWAYTDVLAELARGMAGNLVARSVLLVALFAGAMLGGLTAGRLRSTRISVVQVAKCFAGGVLMGWGSLLIPGGNDGLILVGLPLLWPYAWVAFLAMCVAIAAGLLLERAMIGRGAAEAVR